LISDAISDILLEITPDPSQRRIGALVEDKEKMEDLEDWKTLHSATFHWNQAEACKTVVSVFEILCEGIPIPSRKHAASLDTRTVPFSCLARSDVSERLQIAKNLSFPAEHRSTAIAIPFLGIGNSFMMRADSFFISLIRALTTEYGAKDIHTQPAAFAYLTNIATSHFQMLRNIKLMPCYVALGNLLPHYTCCSICGWAASFTSLSPLLAQVAQTIYSIQAEILSEALVNCISSSELFSVPNASFFRGLFNDPAERLVGRAFFAGVTFASRFGQKCADSVLDFVDWLLCPDEPGRLPFGILFCFGIIYTILDQQPTDSNPFTIFTGTAQKLSSAILEFLDRTWKNGTEPTYTAAVVYFVLTIIQSTFFNDRNGITHRFTHSTDPLTSISATNPHIRNLRCSINGRMLPSGANLGMVTLQPMTVNRASVRNFKPDIIKRFLQRDCRSLSPYFILCAVCELSGRMTCRYSSSPRTETIELLSSEFCATEWLISIDRFVAELMQTLTPVSLKHFNGDFVEMQNLAHSLEQRAFEHPLREDLADLVNKGGFHNCVALHQKAFLKARVEANFCKLHYTIWVMLSSKAEDRPAPFKSLLTFPLF